jgi:hypothetical protein
MSTYMQCTNFCLHLHVRQYLKKVYFKSAIVLKLTYLQYFVEYVINTHPKEELQLEPTIANICHMKKWQWSYTYADKCLKGN